MKDPDKELEVEVATNDPNPPDPLLVYNLTA